jgi:hypothetical protein
MRLRFAITVPVVLCCIAPVVCGQEPLNDDRDVATLKTRVDTFFRQLAGSGNAMPDAERAVREIIGSGPLKDRTMEIDGLIEQAQTVLEQRYGAYTGHEMASVRPVGNDLIFLRYLYKGERYPVVWYFTFYRSTSRILGSR